jgi:hypothetical protein
METKELDIEEWESALPSSGYEVFHEPEALSVIDDHTDSELRLFGVFKSGQAVALLPVFVTERVVGRTVFSPPPSFGIPRLGPIINPLSPKRRKHERINQTLSEYVVETLGLDRQTTLFRMVCPVEYDPRPYAWNGFSLQPQFTYTIDLAGTDLETVMGRFSKSLRNEMRRYESLDLFIERKGVDSALRIYDQVLEKYTESDTAVPLAREFLADLLTDLDDELFRVYVARTPDGEYKSGIIVLLSPDRAYYWQGGVASSYENVSVNTILQRVILEDLLTDPALDSVDKYDLVGANTKRLCDYKGKFNSELDSYYAVESASPAMELAKSTYKKFG